MRGSKRILSFLSSNAMVRATSSAFWADTPARSGSAHMIWVFEITRWPSTPLSVLNEAVAIGEPCYLLYPSRDYPEDLVWSHGCGPKCPSSHVEAHWGLGQAAGCLGLGKLWSEKLFLGLLRGESGDELFQHWWWTGFGSMTVCQHLWPGRPWLWWCTNSCLLHLGLISLTGRPLTGTKAQSLSQYPFHYLISLIYKKKEGFRNFWESQSWCRHFFQVLEPPLTS